MAETTIGFEPPVVVLDGAIEQPLTDLATYRAVGGYAQLERARAMTPHDVTDQLSLIHLLGHYSIHRRPPRLELVNISDFPGARRFTGLGELPPVVNQFRGFSDRSRLRLKLRTASRLLKRVAICSATSSLTAVAVDAGAPACRIA